MQWTALIFFYLFLNSDLLLEATECLLIPKRKSQMHNHRVAPRRPTSVNHVLYAIGGMSRREASKSGEKYDPKERKWKTIGEVILSWYQLALLLDCEQSLFNLKIRGEERKTSKHASKTAKPRVASSAGVSQAHDRSLVLCCLRS